MNVSVTASGRVLAHFSSSNVSAEVVAKLMRLGGGVVQGQRQRQPCLNVDSNDVALEVILPADGLTITLTLLFPPANRLHEENNKTTQEKESLSSKDATESMTRSRPLRLHTRLLPSGLLHMLQPVLETHSRHVPPMFPPSSSSPLFCDVAGSQHPSLPAQRNFIRWPTLGSSASSHRLHHIHPDDGIASTVGKKEEVSRSHLDADIKEYKQLDADVIKDRQLDEIAIEEEQLDAFAIKDRHVNESVIADKYLSDFVNWNPDANTLLRLNAVHPDGTWIQLLRHRQSFLVRFPRLHDLHGMEEKDIKNEPWYEQEYSVRSYPPMWQHPLRLLLELAEIGRDAVDSDRRPVLILAVPLQAESNIERVNIDGEHHEMEKRLSGDDALSNNIRGDEEMTLHSYGTCKHGVFNPTLLIENDCIYRPLWCTDHQGHRDLEITHIPSKTVFVTLHNRSFINIYPLSSNGVPRWMKLGTSVPIWRDDETGITIDIRPLLPPPFSFAVLGHMNEFPCVRCTQQQNHYQQQTQNQHSVDPSKIDPQYQQQVPSIGTEIVSHHSKQYNSPPLPLSSTIMIQKVVSGVGRFTALSDGRFRAVFESGVMITLDSLQSKYARVLSIDGEQECDISDMNYGSHVAAIVDFAKWVASKSGDSTHVDIDHINVVVQSTLARLRAVRGER